MRAGDGNRADDQLGRLVAHPGHTLVGDSSLRL